MLLAKETISEQRTTKRNWRYFKGDVYRYEINAAFSWIAFGEGFKEGPKDETWYKDERILLRRLMSRSHRLMAGFATDDFVTNKNLYIIKPRSKEVDLRVMLGIINSRLYSHLYSSRISGAVKDDFPQVTMTDFLALPCPSVSASPAKIGALVDRVLEAKKADPAADTTKLEADIDALVYKLYGLTDDEIAVVEGRDKAEQQIASADSQAPATPPRKRDRVAVAEEHVADDDEVLE